MIKIDDKAKKRQFLKERFNRLNKAQDSARLLNSWLAESDLNVDLVHVFQSLEDNRNKIEQLPVCSDVIAKFTYKACQTNRAIQLLQAIDNLRQDYQDLGQSIPTKLYLSKYYCLKHYENLDAEAENCLHRAIELVKNDIEKNNLYFELSRYYEDIGEYKKMKEILLKCEEICLKNSSNEEALVRTWVMLGHYYFDKLNLVKSKKYLTQVIIKLELLCKQQKHKLLMRTLSECWHYLGLISFEEHDFIESANLYLKSQKVLEEGCKYNNLTLDVGATAFYHLRLGEVLDACQIKDSAKYHYDQSQRLFNERGHGSSTLVHVNLALANLIESESDYIKQDFQKKEKQIKDAAKKAQETGYPRGYLKALVQLLILYQKSGKIHLLLKIVLDILVCQEFRNLGGVFFLKNYIYYKFIRNSSSSQILSECPCSDPKCKIAAHKQIEKVQQAVESRE